MINSQVVNLLLKMTQSFALFSLHYIIKKKLSDRSNALIGRIKVAVSH